MYEFVARGGVLDPQEFTSWESSLEENARGVVELDLRLPASLSIAAQLQDQLRSSGIEHSNELHVLASGKKLQIYFRKGFPWLAVIAAAVLGLIVLAVLITGWKIFREVVPESWQPFVGGTAAILALGLGAILLIRSVRK